MTRKKITPRFPAFVVRYELIKPDANDECVNAMQEYYSLESAEWGFAKLMQEQMELNGGLIGDVDRKTHAAWLRGQAVFKAAGVRIVVDRFSKAFMSIMNLYTSDTPKEIFQRRCLEDKAVAAWIKRAPLGRRDFVLRMIKDLPAGLDCLDLLFEEKMAYSWPELQERAVNKPKHSEEQRALRNAYDNMCGHAHETLSQEAIMDIFYGVGDAADCRRTIHPPLFDREGCFMGWSDMENNR